MPQFSKYIQNLYSVAYKLYKFLYDIKSWKLEHFENTEIAKHFINSYRFCIEFIAGKLNDQRNYNIKIFIK